MDGRDQPGNPSLTSNSWYLPADGRALFQGQYPGLYNVIGTTYGGNGAVFNLPDLSGYNIPLTGTGSVIYVICVNGSMPPSP